MLTFGHHGQRPFIAGLTSKLFKYELLIKKLSIAEKEFELIVAGKSTMLLRLKDCKILLSFFDYL
jgi:hypothetical protein